VKKLNLPKDFTAIHLAVAVLICLVGGALVAFLFMSQSLTSCQTTLASGCQLTEPLDEEISSKAMDYINNNLITSDGLEVRATGVEKVGESLYVVSFNLFEGTELLQEGEAYITADLENLIIGSVLDLDEPLAQPEEPVEPEEPEPVEVQKTDKPVIELFVMSHCPYGTQMEKALLPVIEALGDKIDFQLKFVYYAMHGQTEVDEQLLQVCVQREHPDKLIPYLSEFLVEGDTEAALNAVELTKEDLNSCMQEVDEEFEVYASLEDESSYLSGRFPLFNVFSEDNEKYGVGGSPTFVLNETVVRANRNSAYLLELICDAFTDAPEECETLELSSESPSSGFGFEGTGSGSGSCG
jgi:hypothetical protein